MVYTKFNAQPTNGKLQFKNNLACAYLKCLFTLVSQKMKTILIKANEIFCKEFEGNPNSMINNTSMHT